MTVVGQGETREEANQQHDLNVFALMKRARERNLKFNPQKIQFKLPKITFMGHVISEQGVEPDPSKVKAINDMPAPCRQAGRDEILRHGQLPKHILPTPIIDNQASPRSDKKRP